MTTDIERNWATAWRGEMLPLLREKEAHGLLPFISAVCCRCRVASAAQTILAYDVGRMLSTPTVAQQDDATLWAEFVRVVFAGAERIAQDRERRRFGPLLEKEDDVPDRAAGPEESYEREQQERIASRALVRAEAAALRRVAPDLPEVLADIKRRMLRADKPIYLLLWNEPHRWRLLIGLFVSLWPDTALFESLASAYQGCLGLPSASDYKKAERMRSVLHLRNKGHSHKQIAAQLHISRPTVAKTLAAWKASRLSDSAAERRLLSAFNEAIRAVMGAAVAEGLAALEK